MSYIEDQTNALTQVFDRAVELKSYRLAGYAANVDFWGEEIKRCLSNIDRYPHRFQRLVDAVEAYRHDPLQVRSGLPADLDQGYDSHASSTPAITDSDRARLRERLAKSASRFLIRCLTAELIDRVKLLDLRDDIGLTPEELPC